ncbi:uncharacterized protein LOC122387402 [Amphibalanus amphitrite]|uniref:uncharacterized protein LOC122387402 n=1 Tax=Amphibalanus amphitrite TaxID=1232801 RepID=UPI001C92B0CC|nr:uncharacterized protein LOC122387402 [Amphibalanus amphitrite]
MEKPRPRNSAPATAEAQGHKGPTPARRGTVATMTSFSSAVCLVALLAVVACQDGGYKEPQGYFQYLNVPAHKQYEFGWKRGNPHHFIGRYEQAKDHRFRTRVNWGDSKGGHGEHYFEYNHAPKGYGGEHHAQDYSEPEPAYAPELPAYPPLPHVA